MPKVQMRILSTATMEASFQQIFQQFENYDFEDDATFQNGLKSIVNNNQTKSEEEQQEAIRNANFVQNFDYNEYQAWRAHKLAESASGSSVEGVVRKEDKHDIPSPSDKADNLPSSGSTAVTGSDPSYPKSFQEICELIASGKPIPGIRQIPNSLAEGTPSEAKMAPKPKPWEKKTTEASVPVQEAESVSFNA
ncbi:hypothetical protein BGX28_004863 [Mortierella sp. GBA30]|nr:hypothetical protein BGX28_004863 [Mortierella sp. GBA30]